MFQLEQYNSLARDGGNEQYVELVLISTQFNALLKLHLQLIKR